MAMTLPFWTLPLFATVAVWAWACLMPMEPSRGDYDFGPSIRAIMRLVVGIIVTLVAWLSYFAGLALVHAGGLS